MLENSGENPDNLDDNFNSGNQENLNDHDIQLNPNRKKILPNRNLNQNDFDEKDRNNEMNHPGENFYHDNERNVTEEISDATMKNMNKCLGSIGKYFNVELNDLKLKLKGAIIPFNKSFYQSIEINGDLYGPFWIFTTIIFLIALIGNISSYFHAEDKKPT